MYLNVDRVVILSAHNISYSSKQIQFFLNPCPGVLIDLDKKTYGKHLFCSFPQLETLLLLV